MESSINLLIKYSIETLNRENGGSKFEQIASCLAEKEICSNIIPSTGPYGGGDKGIDSKTHKVYLRESSNAFRLWQSSEASPTKKRIIFAFSINKYWKAKLKKDIENIIKNDLNPDEICFITNQFIKTKDKENYADELEDEFGVTIEIFDGTWLSRNLADKYYDLAVSYLGLPEIQDPALLKIYDRIYGFRKEGMTDAESVKVKELLERASYRASYANILEQRVIDLKEAADIQAKYPKVVDQSLMNYEEALTEADNVSDKLLLADLYHAYFRALLKLKLFEKIAKKLEIYAQHVIRNHVIIHYPLLFSWVGFLMPHQDNIGSFELKKYALDCFDAACSEDLSGLPGHLKACLEEAKVFGKMYLSFIGERQDDILRCWQVQLETYKDEPLYPISMYSKLLSSLAPLYEGDPSYDELYDNVESILLERNNKLDAAQLRKDRAVSLFQGERFEDAIHHLNIVKLKWYDAETLRGSMLSSLILSQAYSKVGLSYAAVYELFTVLHLSTSDEEIHSKHKDLFIKALCMLYSEYLRLGLYGSALIMGKFALSAIHQYRFDPYPNEPFPAIFDHNLPLILNAIRAKYPALHRNLLNLLEDSKSPILEIYQSLVDASDEEFEKYIIDVKDQTVARELREALKNNKAPINENEGVEILNEHAEKQQREFEYKGIRFKIYFDNSYENKLIAEHIRSFLQIVLVELLNKKDLTWVEPEVIVNIMINDQIDSYHILDKPNNDAVELDFKINSNKAKEFYSPLSDIVGEVDSLLLFEILMKCAIDEEKDIKKLIKSLVDNGFMEALFSRLPFGLPFSTYFSEEDYKALQDNNEQ